MANQATPRSPRHRGWYFDQVNNRYVAAFNGTEVLDFDANDVVISQPTTLNNTLGGLTGLTVTSGGLTVTAGGLTVTAGGLTVTAGGLLVSAGRIREVLTPADVDAQNNTLTVAQIVGGIVVHTSVTGGGTVTTDTATNIVAGDSGVGALTANGQTLSCYYINDGTQVLTLAGGTGVTIADAGQTIGADEAALLLFRRTSATAVTVYILGA